MLGGTISALFYMDWDTPKRISEYPVTRPWHFRACAVSVFHETQFLSISITYLLSSFLLSISFPYSLVFLFHSSYLSSYRHSSPHSFLLLFYFKTLWTSIAQNMSCQEIINDIYITCYVRFPRNPHIL
jgi:hypothetical protein